MSSIGLLSVKIKKKAFWSFWAIVCLVQFENDF